MSKGQQMLTELISRIWNAAIYVMLNLPREFKAKQHPAFSLPLKTLHWKPSKQATELFGSKSQHTRSRIIAYILYIALLYS